MTRLVLATGNPDKISEIAPLLAVLGVEPVAAGDRVEGWDVEETALTLEGNARLKARAAARATGLPAIGDDTGLFVDALGGEPGVRSSRYAGENVTYAENVAKLLAALSGVPEEARNACFRTVVALCRPDGTERSFSGELAGRITRAPVGHLGFGYDPVFRIAGDGRTLAELPLEEKNALSHRARALAGLVRFLREAPGWLTGV